jgi:hypothetical protein
MLSTLDMATFAAWWQLEFPAIHDVITILYDLVHLANGMPVTLTGPADEPQCVTSSHKPRAYGVGCWKTT